MVSEVVIGFLPSFLLVVAPSHVRRRHQNRARGGCHGRSPCHRALQVPRTADKSRHMRGEIMSWSTVLKTKVGLRRVSTAGGLADGVLVVLELFLVVSVCFLLFLDGFGQFLLRFSLDGPKRWSKSGTPLSHKHDFWTTFWLVVVSNGKPKTTKNHKKHQTRSQNTPNHPQTIKPASAEPPSEDIRPSGPPKRVWWNRVLRDARPRPDRHVSSDSSRLRTADDERSRRQGPRCYFRPVCS